MPEPIDDVLDDAVALLDLDAPRAEAWVSGLLAEFDDVDELLEALGASDRREALAVASALVALEPRARAVAERLQSAGLEPPAFAPFIGTAVAIGAWSVVDRRAQGESVIIEYEHADGTGHAMLVELHDGVAVDLLVGPAGVADIARGEPGRLLVVSDLGVDAACARIRHALARAGADPLAPLTEAFVLNHALVAARVGAGARPVTLEPEPPAVLSWVRDAEADAFAVATLQSALRRHLERPCPGRELRAAAIGFRTAVAAGHPDAAVVAREIGDAALTRAGADDAELLARVAGAYAAPGPRAGFAPAARAAVDSLEWADWLGAVIPLVRAGPGASADPDELVRNINRCGEVVSTVPAHDAPAVASAFACALHAWRVSGAIDDDDRLTPLGVWLLPRALAAAWGSPRLR